MNQQQTANQLYKQYRYAQKELGHQALSFKDWRNKAEQQGMLPPSLEYSHADGSSALQNELTTTTGNFNIPIILAVTAVVMAIGVSVYFIYSSTGKKNVGNTGGEGDMAQ